MIRYNKLYEFFAQFAKDANGIINNQKLNKIKKILMIVGGVGVGVTGLMLVFGIVIVYTTMQIAWMALVIISAFLLSLFGTLLSVGLGLTVGGVAVKYLDKSQKCPNCGDVVKEGELYCDKCGTPLLATKICSNCQTQNEMSSTYCRNCGARLDNKPKKPNVFGDDE